MSTLTERPAERVAEPGAPRDGLSHVTGEQAPPLRYETIPRSAPQRRFPATARGGRSCCRRRAGR